MPSRENALGNYLMINELRQTYKHINADSLTPCISLPTPYPSPQYVLYFLTYYNLYPFRLL
jgi:hypothetical protein